VADDDPQAGAARSAGFLAGFAETERSVHFDPELARSQRELLEEEGDGHVCSACHHEWRWHTTGGMCAGADGASECHCVMIHADA